MFHKVGRLALALVQDKTLTEVLDTFRLKTVEAAVHHEQDDLAQLLAVLATGKECLDAKLFKCFEALVLHRAAHDSHHLSCELERGALKLDTSRGDVEAETKINVQDVAGVVDHDVTVVSILELQQLARDVSHLIEEGKFSLEEDTILSRKLVNHLSHNGIKGWLNFIGNLSIIVLVRVGLHVPDNLMSKQLRELSRFQDVPLHISKAVVAEGLDNLGNIEKGHINGVALQRTHGVLDYEGMILAGCENPLLEPPLCCRFQGGTGTQDTETEHYNLESDLSSHRVSCTLLHRLESKIEHAKEHLLDIRAAESGSVIVTGKELEQPGMGSKNIMHQLLFPSQSLQLAGCEFLLQEEWVNMIQGWAEKANFSGKSKLPLLSNFVQQPRLLPWVLIYHTKPQRDTKID
ncbi:hypothetical protein HG530_005229 [Fusarium avenaceum]|nr:hypothetical protein HG530_005229 [Fusarium avenaceum]